MSEILEFILQFVVEVLCEGLGFGEFWRFWLLVLGGILGTILIGFWSISAGLQLVLGTVSIVSGLVLGIVWHARSG